MTLFKTSFSMRMLLALSTALLPYPTPAKYSPEVRRHLDNQDYQHHGKIIHFAAFSMNYDTGNTPYLDSGTGYESRGQFAAYASKHRKNIQIKTLLAPSLIGANAQKAYELVTRQYSRADLDNPDRKAIDAPEHSSTNYARYLGDRLYDRLCQDHGTPSHFEQQAKKIKQVAHSSIDKDKPAQFDAFLQADARVLAQSLLPVAVQPIEANGLERCYLYAMQLPKEAIRSEQAEVAKESQQLKEQVNSDANYQLHRQAKYLEPGERATLPKVDDSVKESIKLTNQQANGMKEMAALLQ
ncbi:hypothetical protein ACTG10_09760 [Aeromonas hydrophila]|uniref:hypothetical protein n=1 Tax=Aeromonas TaxID=642 RepID=UPI0015DD01ED|nr:MULTISPECIES: hypothetical protein [Aeromonas]BBT07561.1 hypothetical protein WP7S18E06_30600 [Aeromonas hydrophila]HAT2247885.1 hypothetical protein [Aeromonas hydrophila]HAT2383167.1 hypothetical protein [Aeromonas hydrophila]HAT2415504.1 hypothetical protein [Aeromonas hydrophila]HAT2526497.1 hypothetical protein [Aeromonas hydrophila]